EMDASIMDGRTLDAGAVSMIRTVKNPVVLSRIIMTKTKHVMFSGYGALELAKRREVILEPESYFITDHQFDAFKKLAKPEEIQKAIEKKTHGTVGAVALDKKGNLAAATSTGGTSHALPGRIGDSCIIGGGCYANNNTCAVSGTGQGEFLITGVVAHTISMLIELKRMPLQKACDEVIHERNKKQGEMGVIAVDKKGNVSFSFNTKIMRRGCIDAQGNLFVSIYQ
ncbi:MAG TPA: isoaspartyl peptidase/L-asparaginase, partial [Gammaproteobacteria bacterium]|nr:isoaspartyl peptidase/L-asparaginase [Gammaproteobacteria bacterium]